MNINICDWIFGCETHNPCCIPQLSCKKKFRMNNTQVEKIYSCFAPCCVYSEGIFNKGQYASNDECCDCACDTIITPFFCKKPNYYCILCCNYHYQNNVKEVTRETMTDVEGEANTYKQIITIKDKGTLCFCIKLEQLKKRKEDVKELPSYQTMI